MSCYGLCTRHIPPSLSPPVSENSWILVHLFRRLYSTGVANYANSLDLVYSHCTLHLFTLIYPSPPNAPSLNQMQNTTQYCSSGFEVDILKIQATKTSSLPSTA